MNILVSYEIFLGSVQNSLTSFSDFFFYFVQFHFLLH